MMLPFVVNAQDTKGITYDMDSLRIDMEFNLYILAKKQRLKYLEEQKAQIAIEYAEVTKQVSDLEILRDSVFRGQTGFGGFGSGRSVAMPPSFTFSGEAGISQTSPLGQIWFLYKDPNGKDFGTWFMLYNPQNPIKSDGVLLNPDGTFKFVKATKSNKK